MDFLVTKAKRIKIEDPDEQVTLSLIFKQMQKVLESNKLIKQEVAQLRQNNLIEIDA